jgi:hypothetical protein
LSCAVHETAPLFNNLEDSFDRRNFQARLFILFCRNLLRMSRSHEYEKSAPYPQTPWGYMVK